MKLISLLELGVNKDCIRLSYQLGILAARESLLDCSYQVFFEVSQRQTCCIMQDVCCCKHYKFFDEIFSV